MVSANEDPRWWKPVWNPNEEVMKVWDFSDQVKSDIENIKGLFQIEDDEGIGGGGRVGTKPGKSYVVFG